jgi:hypothetical protein
MSVKDVFELFYGIGLILLLIALGTVTLEAIGLGLDLFVYR